MSTMKDLAKVVHYSLSTISKAFYPNTDIAYSTRQEIIHKAVEMGYVHKKYRNTLSKKILLIIDKTFLIEHGIDYDAFCNYFFTLCLQNNCCCMVVEFKEHQTFKNPFYFQEYDGVLFISKTSVYHGFSYPLLSFTLERSSIIQLDLNPYIQELQKVIYEKKLKKLVIIQNKSYKNLNKIIKEKVRDSILIQTIDETSIKNAENQQVGYLCFKKEIYDTYRKKLNIVYLNFSIEKLAKCLFYSLWQIMDGIPLGKVVITPQIHF